MKVYSIAIIRGEPRPATILSAAYELNSFGFFQKSSAKDALAFLSTTIAERTGAGVRQTVEQDNNFGHVYTNLNGLSGVIVTDDEYPRRVAFSLLNKVLDEFSVRYDKETWSSQTSTSSKDGQLPFSALDSYLLRYQNPHEADNILKVQQELDETKIILHKTIESVLERGEKLDNLVTQSEQLSLQSKQFYKVAQKTNRSCCILQ